jgi:hypothetical protein
MGHSLAGNLQVRSSRAISSSICQVRGHQHGQRERETYATVEPDNDLLGFYLTDSREEPEEELVRVIWIARDGQ